MKKNLLMCFKPVVSDNSEAPTTDALNQDLNERASSSSSSTKIKSSLLEYSAANEKLSPRHLHRAGLIKSHKALPRLFTALFYVSTSKKSCCAKKRDKSLHSALDDDDDDEHEPVVEKEAFLGKHCEEMIGSSSVSGSIVSTDINSSDDKSSRIKTSIVNLIVLSLFFTMCFGRVYAVLFNLLYLYIEPHRKGCWK